MADPETKFEMRALADLVPFLIPAVGIVAIIGLTKVLIAVYPTLDVTLLFVAAVIPVLAVLYPFARWWGKRNA
jgi:hypothetical protein